jgi:lipopolysaccharide/colanic/teichoic acid biosynthesis glycosyltransferase
LIVALVGKIQPSGNEAAVRVLYTVERKIFHFLEYGILTFFLYRALRGQKGKGWGRQWAVWAGTAGGGCGLLEEFSQVFISGRHASAWDWLIDVTGVLAALGILSFYYKKRHMRAGTSAMNRKKRPSLTRALFLKRPFDIALASLGILISSPLWLLFGLLIRLQDRGPVFYAQERVGRNGRLFKAFKFRSMIKDAEKGQGPVQAVENDPRVTKIGKILRATAMDELPQLLNIFKGDMSFVGPRALRPNEKEVQGDEENGSIEEIPGYKERHAVRPGLTGLTQVFLPGETPRRKKFRYDLLYIRKRSFWLDLKLMALSFWITFRGKWESRSEKVQAGRRRAC